MLQKRENTKRQNKAAAGEAVDVPAWHGEHEEAAKATVQREKPFKVFVYHHTHWDREWWSTMQDFRIKLVELIDELLDTLDEDPDFRCFLLDGQTIVLKDYFEVRPENERRLIDYIHADRIQCGPWYILPDEFLVGAEAHIRNLWLGERVSQKYGYQNLEVGYIPDTFGHISQIPQLLQGFGIDNAFVWRGLGGPADSFKQEFWWEAPDGSRVLTYWFPDGYYVVDFLHFDNPIKRYDETYGRVRRSLERWAQRATTDNLLMPYGGDHRTIDKRLPRLIRQVNEDLKGFAEMTWSTTKAFIDTVRSQNPELDVYKGEFRWTGADLPHLLQGVLSARMYLKQLNFSGQQWLERYAEPFSALAWKYGRKYDANLLWTAWDLLVQNHPHDSICGCSIDPVHREMMPRFEQSRQIAEILTEKSVQHLNAQIDTSSLGDEEIALVARNPLPWTRTDTVVVKVERTLGVKTATHVVLDEEGREVPFQVRDVEGYRPMTDKWLYTEIAFSATDVPGLGYRAYRLGRREKALDWKQVNYASMQAAPKLKGSEALTGLTVGTDPLTGSPVLDNGLLRVRISRADGTITLTDKRTGETYEGLNAFEDSGDAGDTYNYAAPLGDMVLRSNTVKSVRVNVSVAEAGHAASTLRVDIDWDLPVSLTDDRLSRKAEYMTHRMSSFVTLAAGSSRVDVRTVWDNRSGDHRLRALFPLGTAAHESYAEGHFDVLERPVGVQDPGNGWPEPFIKEKPQQGYVSVNGARRGLTIANKGLPEYDVLDDGQGTIAVTLLRAVGWLSREDTPARIGGAGPTTPTPDAQSFGRNEVEYSIIPHAGSWLSDKSYTTAHEFLAPLYGSHTGKHEGTLPMSGETIRLEGDHTLLLSACKKAERSDSLILRFWNVAKSPTEAKIFLAGKPANVRYVNLKEEPTDRESIALSADGGFTVKAGPAQIVTLEIAFEGGR